VTVFALIPVFNRLEMTRVFIADLEAQQTHEPIHTIVIDDGSTDGTAQFLRSKPNIQVLQGDGGLWWGGAIDQGIREVRKVAQPTDWVLFLNNDTRIGPDFVANLLNAAARNDKAALGAILLDDASGEVLSLGAEITPHKLRIRDRLDSLGPVDHDKLRGCEVACDALSGRGVLYPLSALIDVGGMRPRVLPHYLADYELSVRVRAAGYRLLVSGDAAVLSEPVFGNMRIFPTLWQRFFSVSSSSYLPALVVFWWEASPSYLKPLLPFTAVSRLVYRLLRRR
jgi:GT2 family glycosyltransferase